jgi:hypothetical protein
MRPSAFARLGPAGDAVVPKVDSGDESDTPSRRHHRRIRRQVEAVYRESGGNYAACLDDANARQYNDEDMALFRAVFAVLEDPSPGSKRPRQH